MLFRVGRQAYASADPSAGVRVGGRQIPARLEGRGDTLHVGGVSIAVAPRLAEHRLELRFGDAQDVRRWDLPADEGFDRYLVSAMRDGDVPGSMHVINPARAAPGAAAEPYGGVLARSNESWAWHSNGSARALQHGHDELLPGANDQRRAGHIVRIGRSETDPASTRTAVIIAWLLGALLVAWTWRHVYGTGLALRVAIAGLTFTLVAVRGMLAFRVWLAAPFSTQPTITFLALLIALPATIALYHIWDDVSERARRSAVPRAQLLTLMMPAVAFIISALAVVLLLTGHQCRFGIASIALTPIALGLLGMALLQQLLAPKHPGSHELLGPLAALHPASAHSSLRQFLTGVGVLAALSA